jgi:hypothetical protein
MPVVFIHGVNTRDGEEYQRDQAARDELLHRLLLQPLGEQFPRFRNMSIKNLYWGDLGVSHRWGQQSVPHTPFLQALGAEDRSPNADGEIAGAMETSDFKGQMLEPLGATSRFKDAATRDLTKCVEAILSPLIWSEWRLIEADGRPEWETGFYEALLLVAGRDVAADPETKRRVLSVVSDEEVLQVLRERTQERFEVLLREWQGGAPPPSPPPEALEPLGPDFIGGVRDRVGELFARVTGAPARVASVTTLGFVRDGVHAELTRFMGDVFVYLKRRGTRDGAPGPIIKRVLGGIQDAVKNHPDEPLIILTHSMGGNILYDILTHFAPELHVDVWVSAGGQVGQFEEMKIFVESDLEVGTPDKVTSLGGRVGLWINVFDPADTLSFLASPIFANVQDVQFNSGASLLNAHGTYFKRPSFYDLLLALVKERLP